MCEPHGHRWCLVPMGELEPMLGVAKGLCGPVEGCPAQCLVRQYGSEILVSLDSLVGECQHRSLPGGPVSQPPCRERGGEQKRAAELPRTCNVPRVARARMHLEQRQTFGAGAKRRASVAQQELALRQAPQDLAGRLGRGIGGDAFARRPEDPPPRRTSSRTRRHPPSRGPPSWCRRSPRRACGPPRSARGSADRSRRRRVPLRCSPGIQAAGTDRP